MLHDIWKNKMKSYFIVGVFILIITLILYYVCLYFEFTAPVAIGIALLFSILVSWISYYNSDKIIIAVTKARPATIEEDKRMVQIFESLMISSGLSHTPRLYVVNDPQPNAFATGRNPKNSIVAVTTGLLEKLDYYELEGVIAHEMAHIKNYDIRLSAIMTVMVGFIVMLSDIFVRSMLWGGGKSNNSSDNKNGNAQVILMVVGLVFLILAPILR
jgi:heat shock protein HtpX